MYLGSSDSSGVSTATGTVLQITKKSKITTSIQKQMIKVCMMLYVNSWLIQQPRKGKQPQLKVVPNTTKQRRR
jgi:hypothetical protein